MHSIRHTIIDMASIYKRPGSKIWQCAYYVTNAETGMSVQMRETTGKVNEREARSEAASIEQQGLGWQNTHGSGNAGDTITSGLEGAWTVAPTAWTNNFFENLFGYEWEQTRSPAGAVQWKPTEDRKSTRLNSSHT